MTEIYLIRHTQAEGNRYRMMQGFWDGEVTKKGRVQIEALARRFRDVHLDAVYSSDLSRAVMTAEAAARWGNLPIRTREGLREINIGPWERKFFGNLSYESPELTERFLHDAENWRLEGAETFPEVRIRALKELERIAEENEGRTIAVVSHGVAIRCMMSGITGIPLSDDEHLPIFKNTAVTRLLWDGGHFTVAYMNDDSHLSPAEKTSWNTTRDLRDVPFDPAEDRNYYESCYADAWHAAHGSLKGYRAATYFEAARRHHAVNPGAVLRMYRGEEPVGLVDLDPERGEESGVGWISLLYLVENCRAQGYGIQLLARAIFFYKDLQRSCLRLQVAEDNRIACAFYGKEGFQCIGTQKTPAGKLLLMERELNG